MHKYSIPHKQIKAITILCKIKNTYRINNIINISFNILLNQISSINNSVNLIHFFLS